MTEFFTQMAWPGWNGVFEILVLAVLIYYVLLFISGTRGAQVLSGLVVLVVALMSFTYIFRLDTLGWILQRLSALLAVAMLVIFQPEIRRALAELGTRQFFGGGGGGASVAATLAKSALDLSAQKIGAIIAVERGMTLQQVRETGVKIGAVVTPELLGSIFFPHTPLHDGGVIIKGDRIEAAGCLFPLTQRAELSTQLGTRHRAAIGLTEETDALVLVVSEETGTISVAYKGKLRRGLDEERLRRLLTRVLHRRAREVRSILPLPGWLRTNGGRAAAPAAEERDV